MKRFLQTAVLTLAVIALLPSLCFAQVAVLNGTADKVEVILAGAKATADATVTAIWEGQGGPATTNTTTNGVTAATVLTGIAGPPLVIRTLSVSNTDTAAITLTVRRNNGTAYPIVSAVVLQVNDTLRLGSDGSAQVIDSSGNQRGTANAGTVRTAQTYKIANRAKAGTTAGWTVAAGNNIGTMATVAASQTSATLVIPIDGLHVGDTITGFGVYSSINSAGNAVTLDASIRKLTIAAGATATDAAVTSASITQVSVTAATASSATKTGLSETIVSGTQYYLLLTCSTAASTTLELDAVEITVTSS